MAQLVHGAHQEFQSHKMARPAIRSRPDEIRPAIVCGDEGGRLRFAGAAGPVQSMLRARLSTAELGPTWFGAERTGG